MRKITLIALVASFGISIAHADLYKCKQPDGSVIYQDTICSQISKSYKIESVPPPTPEDHARALQRLQAIRVQKENERRAQQMAIERQKQQAAVSGLLQERKKLTDVLNKNITQGHANGYRLSADGMDSLNRRLREINRAIDRTNNPIPSSRTDQLERDVEDLRDQLQRAKRDRDSLQMQIGNQDR